MDSVYDWVEPLLRWFHVVAGVLWIGLLYFFNWVNGPFAKTLDADTRPKVVPELMPRALYFFRWGAAYTWATGVLLIVLVYYGHERANMVDFENVEKRNMAMLFGIGAFVTGWIIYDIVWKVLQKQEQAGVVVSFLLLAGYVVGLNYVGKLGGRALFIHTGALLGTAMAFNVWFRIWPAQRKIIGAIKAGQAPDPAWGALGALRSKHNTYMSVPLIFMMVSNHMPKYLAFEDKYGWAMALAIVLVGWAITKMVYQKSGGAAPKTV
jgi:uncharacterized membrane protein